MERIIVPISLNFDYSNLLKYAESIARKGAKALTFLIVTKKLGVREGEWVLMKDSYTPAVRSQRLGQLLSLLQRNFGDLNMEAQVKIVNGSFYTETLRELEETTYDLILLGAEGKGKFNRYRYRTLTSRIIGSTKVPVFVVPARTRFNEIQHITYAIDLSDYDPMIVNQVKSIAAMFDAKLTIAHVNVEAEGEAKEAYVTMLDQVISSTLDYPKVYYRFFDHADPFGGIKKLVNLNNSQVLAMTNRTEGSLRERYSPKSMTRKMAKELSLPLLAFKR